ncbi:coumaroyl-CoA:anthocyanidin 3-O-glucoside-6''-O-coumaroyltransferase 2-like [Momordica charantia]|uniref:Coumaroyl-CoA:anthocyanidin 3-O-glucoside-6''-O-coumaroyltransferase 2-like n=1 Tax=Momordica charantia TaxID=3673 RepID=A0A6J1CIJ1_MOMCH|nr:coumaroyl-CoA:anthocyanidin 3-O-glucoside-6''-O-coumaroyltransferase 2-like [Momordica charantia]
MIQSTESELGNGNAICNFEADKSDEPCYLVFAADCRNRLKDPIPFTYFGNCIDICVVELKKNEILKRHSIVGVARAIGERVKEFESEPLKTADKWFSAWRKCEESGRRLAITGSPRLRVYDTDFGWGKPQKSEILNVDSSRLVCLQESRDGKGGIEVGLGLTKTRMDRFVAMWDANLKLFCS